jgi:hypothetical protein
MSLNIICQATCNNANALQFLRDRGILRRNHPSCPQCSGLMTQICDNRRLDGAIYRCPVHKNEKKSIRDGSFLSDSRLTLSQFIHLVYEWAHRTSITDTQSRLAISPKTIVQWFQFFRDCCSNYMEQNPNQIGGLGHVVEINESVISKRKYNRGQMICEKWIFGGIEEQAQRYPATPA